MCCAHARVSRDSFHLDPDKPKRFIYWDKKLYSCGEHILAKRVICACTVHTLLTFDNQLKVQLRQPYVANLITLHTKKIHFYFVS